MKRFSVITNEATDVCNTEQLNLSVRWVPVSNKYEVFEIPYSEYTRAETLFTVIKDLLKDVIYHLVYIVAKCMML